MIKNILMAVLSFPLLFGCTSMRTALLPGGAPTQTGVSPRAAGKSTSTAVSGLAIEQKEASQPDLMKQVHAVFANTSLRVVIASIAAQYGGNYLFKSEARPSGGAAAVVNPDRKVSFDFRGTMKELLLELSGETGYFFVLENNVLVAKEQQVISFIVPDCANLNKQSLTDSLTITGASAVTYDGLTGRVTCAAGFAASQRIAELLADLRARIDNAGTCGKPVALALHGIYEKQ